MKRRPHHKTRTGCSQCRKRRVKCDESKPSCLRCGRLRLQCSFHCLAPTKPERPAASITPSIILSDSSLELTHLELLHHYTSQTCLDMGSADMRAARNMQIWQVEIPRLAFAHPFVMHGIFAISAVHLITLQPNRRLELTRRAVEAEQAALPSYRQLVASNDPKSIHAIFAFASFVAPYLLAQSHLMGVPNGRIPDRDDEHPHWFLVLRGVVCLLVKNWSELSQGPLKSLVRHIDPVDCDRNPEDAHYTKLYRMLEPTLSSTAGDREALSHCRLALDELRKIAAYPFSPRNTLDAMESSYAPMVWPGVVSDRFINLVYERKPEALVILAHFCALLKKLNSCWYLRGVGISLLGAIGAELGGLWESRIAWAVAQPAA
ncbi:hypothetical protein K458DRAFT_434162 [Lentithecium fluviatile CBS 122367]|uniref:Zn(2)-C6 fungal-type domain-containing protein n=1 Tax=Lentithecium fluviatile CBS 122367 TaxID=1168545 RepID=A0A6G1IRY0_9PLEO|nr:hypothetical protein K458DRAFT_434162 [Lentithecium fluviatile CBS 122367]